MKTNISLALVILLTAFSAAGCRTEAILGNPDETKTVSENVPETGSEKIEEGLSMVTLAVSGKNLAIITIDPEFFSFSVYENGSPESAKTIREIHEENKAMLTFNGGFYTEDFKPTGLLVSRGKVLRKLSGADLLDGIIAIDKSGKARFFSESKNIDAKNLRFAIQNGPVLIDENGNIPLTGDSNEKASRTALGIDNKGNLVLIVMKQSLLNTDNTISLYELAHLLKETPGLAGMELHSVVNLDGGPSTGFMIGDHYYPEMEKVQNVVVVKKA
ncbi:MAG TPA: phosphodiester glycosidase family protein [Candidatus Gracilibacteria bacterium]|nr:phosphodiester glycosidase family protein [Candidatus Gracilibacteria bacterium]